MEEWEYLEGHWDLYKDVMMENRPPLTSPGLSNTHNVMDNLAMTSHINTDLVLHKEGHVPQPHSPTQKIKLEPPSHEVGRSARLRQHGGSQVKEESVLCPPKGPTSGTESDISDTSTPTSSISKEEPGTDEEDVPEDPLQLNLIYIKVKEETSLSDDENVVSRDMSTPNDLPEEHNMSSLGVEKAPVPPHRTYNCSKCNVAYANYSDFVAHKVSHPRTEIACSECGKQFLYNSQLIRHQRTHTAEKPFPCPQCGKSFTCKSEFFKHQVAHTREKSYSCAECGKRFMRQLSLNNHRITHTDDKPFACAECGKHFKWQHNLSLHQRIHTREKPYECSECGKCFTCRSNLIYHHITHTREKPFTCPKCGQRFAFRPQLTRHGRTHQ